MTLEPREAVDTTVEVRYAETDQQGIAYHANFLIWMEIGRTKHLEGLGFPYSRLEAEGLLFSVLEARCRYAGAARYGEHVRIATRVVGLRSRTVTFAYDMDVEGRPVAHGETTLIALDRDRRPRRMPADVVAALERGPAKRA